MNSPEKRRSSPFHRASVLLLLPVAALILMIGIQPAQQAEARRGVRLSAADIYQKEADRRFALVTLADFVQEEPEITTEPVKPDPEAAESVPAEAAATLEETEAVPAATEAPTETPTEAPTEAPAEAPRRHYSISDTAQIAPQPDPSCYGEVESAAEMAPIIARAADILEGQDLYFSTDMEIQPDSKIFYYLDETMFAVVWKQVIEKGVFTYAEVKVMDPSQFRRFLSGGEFGSGKLSLTSEMAQSVNAVVGCSGDFYSYRYAGVEVMDGIAEKCTPGVRDNCFVDYDGNLILVQDYVFASIEELQDFVDEHNINFSLSFGPVLVKDGEFVCPKDYRPGEVRDRYPRAAICQMDTLHYLHVVSNRENYATNMFTMIRFAGFVAETGCIQAYALDGGQTATVVMDNEVRNHVNYGSERQISDIIYFATAKPLEE